jgi:hypothetical protein
MSNANSSRVRGWLTRVQNPSPGFSLALETTLSRKGRENFSEYGIYHIISMSY